MQETDGVATGMARRLEDVDIKSRVEMPAMPGESEPRRVREQLERRRGRAVSNFISTVPSCGADCPVCGAAARSGFSDPARIHDGNAWHLRGVPGNRREQERPIMNCSPAKVCLDCLSTEERRALEGDLELASVVQREGYCRRSAMRFGDWLIHYT